MCECAGLAAASLQSSCLRQPVSRCGGARRLLVGTTVTVTLRGVPTELEAGAGTNAKGLAEEFARVKASA